MTEIIRIKSVAPVLFGVVKIEWMDGYQGVVDLRPVLTQGEIFRFLREAPARFDAVQRDVHGHYIFWLDDDGDEVEFGADSLRRRAERQAEILRLAS